MVGIPLLIRDCPATCFTCKSISELCTLGMGKIGLRFGGRGVTGVAGRRGLGWEMDMCDRTHVGFQLTAAQILISSIDLICRFLTAMKKLLPTTKHRALGFQKDGWSCGFQTLNITKVAPEHRGSFSDVPLVPMGPGFVDYVLSNAHCAVRVIQAPGDDVEDVTELPCPPEPPPPSTQVEVATPTPTQRQGGPRRAKHGKPKG